MRRHRKLLIAVPCLAALLAIVAFLSRDQEPQSQGRQLSYWIYLYTASRYRWPHPEAPHAWTRDQEWLRVVAASDALKVLGPAATSAAPDLLCLARRARNPAGAQQIVEALASRGPDGVLALGEILTNAPAPSAPESEAHARSDAIFRLTNMGPNALPAVPALVQCLADGDEQVATQAALALNSIVVTVVSESLAGLGGRPRHVTPSLVALLNAKASQVREAITNAILEIAPDALTNAPAR